MYAVGDKYGIAGLKATAAENFTSTMSHDSPRPNDPQRIERFIATVAVVYGTTPENDRCLRIVVSAYTVLALNFLSPVPEFKSLIADYPEFILDVTNRMNTSRAR